MELYELKTKGLGEYFVVEKDPTSAIKKLETLLNKSDYGSFIDRDVVNIKIITGEIKNLGIKPNFSGGNKLILSTSCEQIIEPNLTVVVDYIRTSYFSPQCGMPSLLLGDVNKVIKMLTGVDVDLVNNVL